MNRMSFESFPFWLNIIIYIISAGAIWVAGYYLEKLAGVISQRTILGQAFIGILLLSLADTLPEIATTVTAIIFLDNPTLAVHNLIGGVALQTAFIIAADWSTGDTGAFTFFTPRFVLLIEGVGVLVLLQIFIAGITASGVPLVGPVSLWPVLLFITYLCIMYLTYHEEERPRWKPADEPGKKGAGGSDEDQPSEDDAGEVGSDESMNRIWLLFAGASAVVLMAGWAAAKTADVFASASGLSHAFLGATLLALATSLPELSTIINASRDKRYNMAISNIFGGCALNVALIFLMEMLYLSGTIMIYAQETVIFIASVSALLICLYLWGLMERDNRTILGIGWDSAACLVVYLGAMAVLYFIS